MKVAEEFIRALYNIAEAIRGKNKNNSNDQNDSDENILITINETKVNFDEFIYENNGVYFIKKDIKFSDIYNVETDKVLEFVKYLMDKRKNDHHYGPILNFYGHIYDINSNSYISSNLDYMSYENLDVEADDNIDFENLTKDTIIFSKDRKFERPA